MADIDEYERNLWEYEQAEKRRKEQAERVARVEREGVDATVARMDKDWKRLAKMSAEARALRDSLKGVPSPAEQHLITTLENRHVTLSEFQKMHGLEPDGILGPATQKLIADLEYKRQNNAEIDRLVEMSRYENNFADAISKMLRKPKSCEARAYARNIDGEQTWHACDKGDHDYHTVPHGATFQDPYGGPEFRVRWRHNGDGYFQLARGGNWASFHESEWHKARGGYIPITRPQEFVQVQPLDAVEAADHVIRAIDAATGHYTNTEVTKVVGTGAPTPDVSKVMVSDLGRRKPREKMTREKYRTTFEQMQYSVIENLFWGFTVIVSLARGGTWTYRRPTRAWAERVGAKRLKRELKKLTIMYERDNPEGVGARGVGVLFPMTTDEVTEMLAEQDKTVRDAAQAEWDAEFHGEAS